FVVTQPRMPCFKLGIRHGRPDILKRFLATGRSGFYLSVAEEGVIEAGQPILHTTVSGESLTVADINALYTSESQNRDLLGKAAELGHLTPNWRDYFCKRLAQLNDS
ncbi:MAG TPA: MOSC domain-containing protein, partial [Candidatus Eisenbacteria bacterium]